MSGVLRIAFKLLVNDRAKFSALLIGVTFAVFLMVQVTSMFAGVLPLVVHDDEHRRLDLDHGSGRQHSPAIPSPTTCLMPCAAWTA